MLSGVRSSCEDLPLRVAIIEEGELQNASRTVAQFELLGVGSTVGWIRRASKIEILLYKKSTMPPENDEACLEKVM
jgi:hypothetical protein